ncbi:PASTA domain-containing protein [Actinoalloteichus spitiensis]|uniref:PASTA domain-containing protein n=1 Tax=Actinoalloteichus spitiensis TaxID=252394 RepID=UPI00035F339A|nr:PASTA domain-containing protein [Actinoalloteichus spitiensis]
MARRALTAGSLAAALSLALVGCSNGEETSPDPAAPPPADQTVEEAPTSDPAEEGEPVTVPDVTGLDGRDAEDALEEAGITEFEYRSVDPEDDIIVAPGNWVVEETDPEAGTEITTEDTVTLQVSKLEESTEPSS